MESTRTRGLRPPNILLLSALGEARLLALLDYDDVRVINLKGLGERWKVEGVAALEAAFRYRPSRETDFT